MLSGLPQVYGDNYSAQYIVPLQTVSTPTRGGRHHATVMIRTPRQQTTRNVDDVINVKGFFAPNLLECLCCCPIIAFVGLIFSLMYQSAKYKGKRRQVEIFSLTAEVQFGMSVIGGFIFTIVIISIQPITI